MASLPNPNLADHRANLLGGLLSNWAQSWRIRSVIWAGILYLLTSWLWLLFIVPGWIAWGLISIWFLYRIVKGMMRMNAGLAVEAA